MRAIGIEKATAAKLKFDILRRTGARSICLAAVFACGAAPGWALGLSVGGISVGVGAGAGHGGVGVGAGVGVGGISAGAGVGIGANGVGAQAGVSVGATGGTTGTGGTGTGTPGGGVTPDDDTLVDDDVNGTTTSPVPTMSTKSMVCARDGNVSAYNGFPVRDRKGEVLGWVHDAVVSPDDKLLTVRLQSTGKTCYKLSSAGFRVRNGEVWTNVDAAALR